MNSLYLMHHISYHLHTIVKRYNYNNPDPMIFCARPDFHDELLKDTNLMQELIKTPDNGFPLLLSVNYQLAYASTATPEGIFVIGPVRFSSPVHLKKQIETDSFTASWLYAVPICEFEEFIKDVLLVYNLFQENFLSPSELTDFNCIEQSTEHDIKKYFSCLEFENQELEQSHNPYDQEVREFSSIENGDVELLNESFAEDYTGKIGILAKDPLRNEKNLGIVVVTLASRAAIRGGVLPEISFSLSDSYIRKMEEADDITTVSYLTRQSEYQYAQLVHDLKEQQKNRYRKDQNPRVNQCKDYIFTHLHGKIRIQDIADELSLNANYLSEIFRQCEGSSITEFITREKINQVKKLLMYSQYSYIEISAYLGFSSQSHLGKQFKKLTGITLRQYREKYGVK